MAITDVDDDVVLIGSDDIRDFNAENILPLPAEDLAKIKEWLQPTAYDLERSEFTRHLASHLGGTGQWLISTTTYQQWLQDNKEGLLLIKGVPGSGKSVMAASIINQLSSENIPVLYFFFRQIIAANHQPLSALRDWLCQILPFSPPLQVKLKEEYLEQKRSLESLSLSDLWKDLKFALSAFPEVYCVTDALDEMDQGNDDFIRSLVDLGRWKPSAIKVLITSRPVDAVETPLRPFGIPYIRLEENIVDKDIATYVQYRLQNSYVPHGHWDIIKEAIPGRANGLFLYAKLSMDAFLESGADINKVLKALPDDLNMMYNDLLREHARRSAVPDDLQLLILQFVTHATRPLRLLEISEMLKTIHAPIEGHTLNDTKNLVRAACGPLLEILPDETVSVVHHSFTEFLKGLTRSADSDESTYPVLDMGPTNHRLAIACLDYLKSGCLDKLDVEKWINKTNEENRNRRIQLRLQFPFLEYAAANWQIHVRRAAQARTDLSYLHEILDTFFADHQRLMAWLIIEWPTNDQIQDLTPLHIAARVGLTQYVIHLLQMRDIRSYVQKDTGKCPLFWAAQSGHADTAQILIANGADPQGMKNGKYTPLYIAAGLNHADVVKLLLSVGVHPYAPIKQEARNDSFNEELAAAEDNPFMRACANGHTKSVIEFLPYIKNTEVYRRALTLAARTGHAEVVDLILRNSSIDVNGKFKGTTLLFDASECGDLEVIEVLLRAGADPNGLSDYTPNAPKGMAKQKGPLQTNEPKGYTALQAVCRLSGIRGGRSLAVDPECVTALLKAGANTELKTPHGYTALFYACEHDIKVVQLLLDAGADPTVETDDGRSVLHTNGRTDRELLPIIVGRGLVNINKVGGKTGQTPLFSRVITHYNERIVKFLEYKPDVNITDTDGNSALHSLLGSRIVGDRLEVLDALLSAGADPNLPNNQGEISLHMIRRDDDPEVVLKLTKTGAKLEARDSQGQTALFKYIMEHKTCLQDRKIFQTFVDLGARLDTRDNKGRTLLHLCVADAVFFQHLIDAHGLDPTVLDYKGNSLFIASVSRESKAANVTSFQRLATLGLDIDQPNISGKTVLHKLCCNKSRMIQVPQEDELFSYVLQVSKNVNPQDTNGVRPLHLAVTASDGYVFQLLNAGADIFSVTNEGMSVLHIAARASQPGIVSLILARISEVGETRLKTFINQQNVDGNTALHYACQSGRPETVKALLEAGADPNLPGKDGHTPFRACADFEVEIRRWRKMVGGPEGKNPIKPYELIALRSGSVPTESDLNELKGGWGSGFLQQELDTARLDEIFDMLILHGAVVTGENGAFQDAIYAASLNQRDYTVNCLLRLQARIPGIAPVSEASIPIVIAAASRVERFKKLARDDFPEFSQMNFSQMKGYISLDEIKYQQSRRNRGQNVPEPARELSQFYHQRGLEHLLGLRQYECFAETVQEIDMLEINRLRNFLPHLLVKSGFTELIDRGCTRHAAKKFDDPEWCLQAETKSGCLRLVQSLLFSACDRNLPNMNMLKLLVEKKGVDINARFRRKDCRRTPSKVMLCGGVLHDLVRGRTWWDVNQAMPYLIEMGADLELKNEKGETPLHVALDCVKRPFYKDAVRILVDGGANVNAVSMKGKTCLSKAVRDLEMINLLLSHGAEISATAIFAAIEFHRDGVLELLLSKGDYANMKRPKSTEPEKELSGRRPEVLYHEMPPLLYAASDTTFSARTDPIDRRAQAMTALLNHGADPYATFTKNIWVEDDGSDNGNDSDPESGWRAGQCIVIHEILSKPQHPYEPFLRLPSLQLEHRDSKGRTLLLAASERYDIPSTRSNQAPFSTAALIQELLDRGADVAAQDNDGKTVLHKLMETRINEKMSDLVQLLLTKEPQLVHMVDKSGNTAFHYVLPCLCFRYVELLLENGADPLKPNSKGHTGLHILAENLDQTSKATELFKQFHDAGLDINARNTNGETPLFAYLKDGLISYRAFDTLDHKIPKLKFFEGFGADFYTQDNAGTSLLHLMANKKVRRGVKPDIEAGIFRYLMDMGLDHMLEDAQHRTSLDVAAACDKEHILKLFERKRMG